MEELEAQFRAALDEFIPLATLKPGQILVVGCSTSEVLGHHIGSDGSSEVAEVFYRVLAQYRDQLGIHLAIQCCEHLNRALVVTRQCLEQYFLTEVSVIPQVKAGGALAARAFACQADACVVENIQGHAGIDIGNTFIGMHLKPVAIPIRLTMNTIGKANMAVARTRPKLIGGPRACYENCI